MLMLLYPGVGLKRWLFVGSLGIAVWSIGIAFLLRKFFELPFPDFLPWNLEGFLLAFAGFAFTMAALYGIYRSVGPLILASDTIPSLAETIYTRRSRGRGPRIVAIGGGTGMSVLLRGLKQYTDNLTAIITVADDGGSSGRLRRELGVLPPGDFRNCLVAMSESESLLTELFQYRFAEGDGLKGHSFGNLFIAALSEVTNSFERAIFESSKVLAVHGQIVPATLSNLSLSALLKDGITVQGESKITEHGGEIERLFIHPEDAKAYQPAVDAIEQAQMLVIGPGSLYTSVLPNLLVQGISEAIRDASATKIYVCNVATESGETKGYAVVDHVEALQRHTFTAIVDHVVANSNPSEQGTQAMTEPVVHDGRSLEQITLQESDLSDEEHPVRHDSSKLARTVIGVYHDRRRNRAPFRLALRS
jgi:uncharacterized cofD-like protein